MSDLHFFLFDVYSGGNFIEAVHHIYPKQAAMNDSEAPKGGLQWCQITGVSNTALGGPKEFSFNRIQHSCLEVFSVSEAIDELV